MSPRTRTRTAGPLDWTARAQCVAEDMDRSAFFPEPGRVGATYRAAIECCGRCAVRDDCYDFGRATGSSGIFGGVSLAAGYDKANP